MTNKRYSKLVLGAALSACLSSGAYAGDFMTVDQIKAAFSGKTLDGQHLRKGYSFSNYFDPSGKLYSIRDGEKRLGEWRINNKGKHCVQWEDSINEYCRLFRDNGDGSYTKIKIKGDRKIEILTLKNVRDGNQLGK